MAGDDGKRLHQIVKGWMKMYMSKMIRFNWMHIAMASLALVFVASPVWAVGVDEPEPDEAAVTADDGDAAEAGERGHRGRRGFRRDRFGDEGFEPGVRRGAKGRRGKRGGRRPGVMLWNRMTEEERDEVLDFMTEHYPEVAESLEAVDGEEGEPKLNRRHARMLPEILRMHELSEEDPAMFEIKVAEQQSRFELRRLIREYRQADDDETKDELSTQIKPLVEAAFDAQQSRMEKEVVRLEKRLEGLRNHIAKRADNRDAEIEQSFADVLEGKEPRGERLGRERKRRGFKKGRERRESVAIPELGEPGEPQEMDNEVED